MLKWNYEYMAVFFFVFWFCFSKFTSQYLVNSVWSFVLKYWEDSTLRLLR